MKLEFKTSKLFKYRERSFVEISCRLCRHLKLNKTCLIIPISSSSSTLESGFCQSFERNKKAYKRLI